MFKNYPPEIGSLLSLLYREITEGKKSKSAIKHMRLQLRGMGLLSIPFSLNKKKLGK